MLMLGTLFLVLVGGVWSEAEHDPTQTEQAGLASLHQRAVRDAAGLRRKRKNAGRKREGKKPKGRKNAKRPGRKAANQAARKRISKRKGKGENWTRKKKQGKNTGRTKAATKGKGKRRSRNRKLRNSRTNTPPSCLKHVVHIMKMWKDVISNFEKQKIRMKRHNGTGGTKTGKKKDFETAYKKLVLTGGDNKVNLSCDGSTTSKGAVQLKNISTVLSSCNSDITKACNTSAWPQPNMTKLLMCEKLSKEFIKGSKACVDITALGNQNKSCSCWNGASLNKTVQAVKVCKFNTEAKSIATAKDKCTKTFMKCRKYEDASIKVITACNMGSSALAKKVRRLSLLFIIL